MLLDLLLVIRTLFNIQDLIYFLFTAPDLQSNTISPTFNSTMDALTTAFNDAAALVTAATSLDEQESSDIGVDARQITTTGNTGSPLDTATQAICDLTNVRSFSFSCRLFCVLSICVYNIESPRRRYFPFRPW